MKPVLLDTGVIVALLQRNSQHHEECVQALLNLERPLVTCEAVIGESCHLLRRVPGAAEAVIANIEHGEFEIPFVFSRHASAIRSIMRKYRDVPVAFADACLIQMAEELDTGEVMTLDSDFAVYRWRKNRRFETLIPLG